MRKKQLLNYENFKEKKKAINSNCFDEKKKF